MVTDTELTDDASRDSEGSISSDLVSLYPGDYLGLEETLSVTRANPTTVVLVAGPVGSGKTTLFASLYTLFQQGPFAGQLFTGSRTLLAFERVCFPSRIDSDRAVPDTERTSTGDGERFLHLGLVPEASRTPRRDLLLPDVSGEVFRDVEDSDDACRKLTLLKRADHLALLVDAGLLADPGRRQAARASADNFLRRCVEAGMLGRTSVVDVVFSKWDLFIAANGDEEFLEETRRQIDDSYLGALGRLRFLKVAARPAMAILPFASGLAELLKGWLETTPVHAEPIVDKLPDNSRSFDRFADSISDMGR